MCELLPHAAPPLWRTRRLFAWWGQPAAIQGGGGGGRRCPNSPRVQRLLHPAHTSSAPGHSGGPQTLTYGILSSSDLDSLKMSLHLLWLMRCSLQPVSSRRVAADTWQVGAEMPNPSLHAYLSCTCSSAQRSGGRSAPPQAAQCAPAAGVARGPRQAHTHLVQHAVPQLRLGAPRRQAPLLEQLLQSRDGAFLADAVGEGACRAQGRAALGRCGAAPPPCPARSLQPKALPPTRLCGAPPAHPGAATGSGTAAATAPRSGRCPRTPG